METVAIAIASAAVVVTSVVGLFGWLSARRTQVRAEMDLAETFAALRARPENAPDSAPDPDEAFVYADYLDRDALYELAAVLQVGVDPVQVGAAQTQTHGEALTTSSDISLGPAQIGQFRSGVGTEEREEESFERSIALQRLVV